MSVGLGIRRQPEETWKEAALRLARPFGLEQEVAEEYEHQIANGASEDRAAWAACYEWDVAELFHD